MAGNIFRIDKVSNEQTINTNRFSVRFIGLNNLLQSAQNSPLFGVREQYKVVETVLGAGALGSPELDLEVSLLSIGLPEIGVEVQNIARFNDFYKAVTRFKEVGEFNMKFVDFVNGSASAIIQLWKSFVGDKATGAIGFKQDFVLPRAEFIVYGPDAPGYEVGTGENEVIEIPWIQKYEIKNLFPTTLNLGEHSSESADARKFDVSFACDNFYPISIRSYDYKAANPLERYKETYQGFNS